MGTSGMASDGRMPHRGPTGQSDLQCCVRLAACSEGSLPSGSEMKDREQAWRAICRQEMVLEVEVKIVTACVVSDGQMPYWNPAGQLDW
ncbi:hypothetical protein NPIL_260931 [Nephila pilipes]|uniref:Uncharacterized protein n=1 Tax=Nephila pilipes TaxID=299642 RepID=A0A8X6UEG6_NEPPI|nr:hypothetical protein NPIL_260931 [Nephila pilipes]